MNSFEKETQTLRELIRQAEKTGESAWTAGEKLSAIKSSGNYKASHGTFAKYCRKEFNISSSTADGYIRIFKAFEKDEVVELLVSHLRVLSEIENPTVRKEVIATLKHRIDDITKKILVGIVALVNGKSYQGLPKDQITRDVKKWLSDSKIEEDRLKHKKKTLQKYGKPLESPFLPDLKMKAEPINEMGVVGLFFLIFPYFDDHFYLQHEKMRFAEIKYVQEPFPDACVICELRNGSRVDIAIEFEHKSYNYILHEHHKSSKECHLIVCWEDNAKTDASKKDSEVIKSLPPVFELKKFLETGKMEFV